MDIYESYAALELKPGVSEAEIKAQYRKLLRKWHPDMNSANRLLEVAATEKTAILNEAYRTIKRHEIPYTIPKYEAGYHREPSHVVHQAKKTYAANASKKSQTIKPAIDNTLGFGWKVALGLAALLFAVALVYNLIGSYGESTLADQITNDNPYTVNQNTSDSSDVVNTSEGSSLDQNATYANPGIPGYVDGVVPYNQNLDQNYNQNYNHEEYEHRNGHYDNFRNDNY
ncbi:MAG: J domain-containing protein [Rubrobacteridae bacterium]|nr:J domain-containing protein [Rubrobacteridae bacterium]